ncbi:MAG: hypothetical protein NTX36_10765 [Proteobacteria bacterium]|nr:hypothetical protein [Pseudomonadota bacterium]
MEEGETKEDIYSSAKGQHVTLERRLQMLLKKPYLTENEELEIIVLKKKKLYFKDIMEKIKDDLRKGEEG